MSASEFHHLKTILRLRDIVAAADPSGTPDFWPVGGEYTRPPRRLGILAGSFNPPHAAHMALANAALADGCEAVLFVVSKRTVDKERIDGLSLEDRLLILRLMAGTDARLAVGLVNRGLYVDQAEIVRSAFPATEKLEIILGYDKIVQVFDSRYYSNRKFSLDRLFELAGVLVAPRLSAGHNEIAELLARPENLPYSSRVRMLRIPHEHSDLSSSSIRYAFATTDPHHGDVPSIVAEFVAETGVFAGPRQPATLDSPDTYALRLAFIGLLSRSRVWAESRTDLGQLVRAALRDDDLGRDLRAILRNDTGGPLTRDEMLTLVRAR